MKIPKLRRPYPSEIAAIEHGLVESIPFGLATLVLGAIIFSLSGCDTSTAATAPSVPDSVKVQLPPVANSHMEICAFGIPPEPSCASCVSEGPYSWGVDMRLSNGDTLYLPFDSAQCKEVGTFPDTTRFKIDGVWQKGTPIEMWMVVDGDLVPFRWKGHVNADSLRTVRWEDEN